MRPVETNTCLHSETTVAVCTQAGVNGWRTGCYITSYATCAISGLPDVNTLKSSYGIFKEHSFKTFKEIAPMHLRSAIYRPQLTLSVDIQVNPQFCGDLKPDIATNQR